MSLIHWWPLNGDTKDYGINHTDLTNSNGAINNNGKIGKCYYLSHSAGFTGNVTVRDLMSGTCSFSLWLKIPETEYKARVNAFTYDSSHILMNSRIFGTNGSYSNTGLCLALQTNNIYSSGSYTAQYLYMGWRDNGSASVWSEVGISLNTWYHVVITKDSDRKMCMYLNGTKVAGPFTATSGSFSESYFYINNGGVWGSGNYNNSNAPMLINDFRIYDHALSAKEVKELSKGLVLHYDFNDPYVEGTTNRYAYSGENPYWSLTFYDGATGNYGYNADSNGQCECVTAIDKYGKSKKMIKVSLRTARRTQPYVHFDYLSGYIDNQTYATVSFDMYSTCTTSVGPYSYYSGYYFSYWNDTTKQWVGGSSTSIQIPNLKINQWNHIVFRIYRDTTEYNSGPGFCPVGTSSSTSDYWLFDNIQIEAKDHATPYVNGTRSAGMIFDCSGYGYDGTLIGDCQVVSNSNYGNYSLLNNSTNIGTSTSVGAAYIKGDLKTSFSPSVLTICFWARIIKYDYQNSGILSLSINSDSPTDYNSNGVHQYDSVFRFNGSSNTGYISASSLIDVNNWHHYALVYNGSVLSSYRDGVSITDASYSLGNIQEFRYIYLGLNVAGGAWRQSKENWADFKIYATALSAYDILAEYQKKASIDRSGILFTGEFEEGNSTNIDITKTAMVKCNNIVEGSSNVKFLNGYTQLEYIQNTSAALIKTGYFLNMDTDSFEIDFQATTLAQDGMIFASSTGRYFWLYHYRSGSGYLCLYLDNGSGQQYLGGPAYDTNRHKAFWNNKKIYVDDIAYRTATGELGTTSSQIFLFSYDAYGSYPYLGKIYRCRIWNANGIQRNLIPAKRNSDNTIGMYDLANKVFYGPTNGTFTAGPEIGKINTIYANEIKEI